MANEIKLTASLTLTNGDLKEEFKPGTLSITQNVQGYHGSVVSVGTSEEDLTVGDIATLGLVALRNLDATNYVQWGPKTTGGTMRPLGRLKPGECAILRLEPGITLRWVANTAACKVQVKLCND